MHKVYKSEAIGARKNLRSFTSFEGRAVSYIRSKTSVNDVRLTL